MTRDEVFAELEGRGVAKAVATFSGGNDEGGVNSIALYDAGDQEVGRLEPYYGHGERYNPETGRFEPVEHEEDKEKDNQLAQALGAPSDERYGSYAGDFSVSGEVIWTLDGRQVQMVYEEQSGYDHHEEYV